MDMTESAINALELGMNAEKRLEHILARMTHETSRLHRYFQIKTSFVRKLQKNMLLECKGIVTETNYIFHRLKN